MGSGRGQVDGKQAVAALDLEVERGEGDEGPDAVERSGKRQGQGGILGLTTAATATITNDDFGTPGTISFAGGNVYTVAESAVTLTLNFSRLGGSTGAVSCTVNTANGTAVFNGNPAGRDYNRINALVVTWANGDAADKPVVITIRNNDTAVEPATETFTVTISAPTGGATLGVPIIQTVTINDD